MASRCCVPGGAGRRLGLSKRSRTKPSGARIPGVQEIKNPVPRILQARSGGGEAGQGDTIRDPD